MGTFNQKDKVSTKTTSYEGGTVYQKTVEDMWVNTLFSYMLDGHDSFYESGEDQTSRFVALTCQMIDNHGAPFVAKAAKFARNELGMRSVSELVAAILNSYLWEGKRKFYADYFHRLDGVGEVFSAIDMLDCSRSHALIRGCADYISSLNAYQLGKYQMKGKKYNLHDIINITHAKSEAVDKYQKGILETPDTWEVAISTSKDDEDKANQWKRLVEEKKLGYLALIRNLRNIIENCGDCTISWMEEHLIPQIENEVAIKKSLIYPYQIYTAWKMSSASDYTGIDVALQRAFITACGNMPKLDGKSAVIVDVSGSMGSPYSKNSVLSILEVSACYQAAFYLSDNDIDVFKFGNEAKKVDMPNKMINPFKLIEMLCENEGLGYGTEMGSVFGILDSHYDRMFVFSDMQVMDGDNLNWYSVQRNGKSVQTFLNEFQAKYGKTTVYSYDLGNYPTQAVSQNENVKYITSLNDKMFSCLKYLESGSSSVIDWINEYE